LARATEEKWIVNHGKQWYDKKEFKGTLMSEENGKLDALIDQVGRLTEGITDIKGVVERVAQTTERVAQTVERVAQTTERQEQNLTRLANLFEQQSQRQSETTDRLVRIVENLLERR
jgi:methyl-accepting chemotaxis protein